MSNTRYPGLSPDGGGLKAPELVIAQNKASSYWPEDGGDGACELDQDAIARSPDHVTAVLFDLRRPEFAAMRLHGRKRPCFVGLYEPRVTDHVGREYGSEAALHRNLPRAR